MSKIKSEYSDDDISKALESSTSRQEAREKLNCLGKPPISRQTFDYWLEKKNLKGSLSKLKTLVYDHQSTLIEESRTNQCMSSSAMHSLRVGHFKRVLIISDLHAPYNHCDALSFLECVKEKIKPDLVVSVGDELDNHAISFHDPDPDLSSAGDELKIARATLAELHALFPTMYIANSNHTSLNYRRSKRYGMSKELLLPYRDLIFGVKDNDSVTRPNNIGDGWHWADSFIVRTNKGTYFKVKHGDDSMPDDVSEINANRMSVVRGHHHSKFGVSYSASEFDLLFCLNVGWLGGDDSLAFAYNKKQAKRPINGCGVILNGHPSVIPMNLKSGHWTGEL